MHRKLTITLEEAVYEGCTGRLASAASVSSSKTWSGRMWSILRSMPATRQWPQIWSGKPRRRNGATPLAGDVADETR